MTNYLARLHWRDHFIQRLETEPELDARALHPAYRAIPYEDDPKLLEAWAEGRTGFPMVDAVMRCLAVTGFANFRMRAMAVSFACAGLHLDWRTIHNPLAKVFLDFEPGIHFSQLQMQAGVVGLNTIRGYSPAKQLLDQDPAGAFVKRWLPELRKFTPEQIAGHEFAPLPAAGRRFPLALGDDKSHAVRVAQNPVGGGHGRRCTASTGAAGNRRKAGRSAGGASGNPSGRTSRPSSNRAARETSARARRVARHLGSGRGFSPCPSAF